MRDPVSCGRGYWDCGLRIADYRLQIGDRTGNGQALQFAIGTRVANLRVHATIRRPYAQTSSIRNPQSAIRNPQSSIRNPTRGTIRDNEAAWSTARHVLGEVLNHANARLTAECIALVSGLIYSGDSMTDIAKRHGISRAAVSKRCVELTELLNLRPSRAMRSLTARKTYRSARIQTTKSHEPTDPTPAS